MTDSERLSALEQVLRTQGDVHLTMVGESVDIGYRTRTAYGWNLRDAIDALVTQRSDDVANELTR